MTAENTDKNLPRVLVVDDEKAIQRFLKNALSSAEFSVHLADSGKEALTAEMAVRPDLIILDMGLPDMDGVEVLRRLREWTKVPVIILSVRDREDEKVTPWIPGPMITLPSPSELESCWRGCVSPSENPFRNLQSLFTGRMAWKSILNTAG